MFLSRKRLAVRLLVCSLYYTFENVHENVFTQSWSPGIVVNNSGNALPLTPTLDNEGLCETAEEIYDKLHQIVTIIMVICFQLASAD